MDAEREAMLQVLSDPQFRSLMQRTSAATSPMGVSDSSADIIPATLTEAATSSVSESKGIHVAPAYNILSSASSRKLVHG